MRTFALTAVVALAATALLDAGAIYGSIFFNGAGLKGAAITIACGGDTVKGNTLDDGSYRVTAPEGKCTFTVAGQPFGSVSADVTSASSATRYSFEVVKGASGFELRRQ